MDHQGHQRLSLKSLKTWEALGYGMFIHFGMSTYDGDELSKGDNPSTDYTPTELDVDQWIRVAKEAGMKYAVLTAKHVSGHCLWPSKYTDYHVGTSSNTTDVVRAFVDACRKYDIMPGIYYCSWDNHHLFGSLTPSMIGTNDEGTWWKNAFTTEEYLKFQMNQIEELLTQYGPIGEVWIDIPGLLPRGYRHKLYNRIAELQPNAVVMMNHGFGDGSKFDIGYAWPSDLVAVERFLPNSHTGYLQWREIECKTYYIPGEVCDPIGREWFYNEDDVVRSDAELLGMYLVSRSRNTNLLLNVPPDKRGVLPERFVDALMRLKANLDKMSV